jgi:phenylacetate-CoA ligase
VRWRIGMGVSAATVLGFGALLWVLRLPLGTAWDIWRAGKETPAALADRQHRRVSEFVEFARAHSAYYRDRYRDLPEVSTDLSALPVVTKPELMARFDEWVTDPHVTRAKVDAFVSDPSAVGQLFLRCYRVWTTSGTTGQPGIFVHDRRAASVYAALVPLRGYRWMTPMLLWRLLRGGRIAVLVATGGHFATADWFEYIRRRWRWVTPVRTRIRILSVLSPLADLVRHLNQLQPTLVVGYPSVLDLLAAEQAAGRLRMSPLYLGTGGEGFTTATRMRLHEVFRCIVRDNYGASEFPYAAFECAHGWLHVNADWLILEPVDAAYRPVPSGQPSHTVLLTNLANHVQPLIRYDLGDSITLKPDPCPCGSRLPAIRVEGRKSDLLWFETTDGRTVRVPPLAITTAVEEIPGVQRVQVIQVGSSALRVRLEVANGRDAAALAHVWNEMEQRLRTYLASQGVAAATIVRAPEPPQQDPVSGKFRQVWSEVSTAQTTSVIAGRAKTTARPMRTPPPLSADTYPEHE